MTKEQDAAIFAAFLGIGVLRTMCRAAKLKLAEKRAAELQMELDTAFPGLAGRSALRRARCSECDGWADTPRGLCPACDAYRDHIGQI